MKPESVSAIVIGILGIPLFTILLMHGDIGQISYTALLGGLALACFSLYGFSRLREVDLKNLKLTLDRIKEAEANVFAKEADLRNIAISLAQIIAFSNAFQGRYKSEEGIELERNWYLLQTNKLLDILAVDSKVRKEILKYDTFYQKAKTLKSTEEKEKFRNDLFNMVKADLENDDKQ